MAFVNGSGVGNGSGGGNGSGHLPLGGMDPGNEPGGNGGGPGNGWPGSFPPESPLHGVLGYAMVLFWLVSLAYCKYF